MAHGLTPSCLKGALGAREAHRLILYRMSRCASQNDPFFWYPFVMDDVVPATEPVPESSAAPAESVPRPSAAPNVAPEPVSIDQAESPAPAQTSEPPPLEPALPSAPQTISAQSSEPVSTWNKVDPKRAREGRTKRLEEQIAKILTFARTKEFVTNDMIEKLLHISDATASRYLRILVGRGQLLKAGRGRGVKYNVI